jgi:hypothetical protein
MSKGKNRTSSPGNETGYGKPPKKYQFKKGQSGNPRGRPKKTRNLLEKESSVLFQQELNRKLTATGPDGQRVTMTFLQAHYRNMCNRAMKGDRYAQKWVNDRIDREEAELMARRQEGFELACDIKAKGMKALEEAQRSGLPEPVLVPDPRDITIDPNTGYWHIAGPITAEDRDFHNWLTKMREEHVEELRELVANMKSGVTRHDAQAVIERASVVFRRSDRFLAGRYKLDWKTRRCLSFPKQTVCCLVSGAH